MEERLLDFTNQLAEFGFKIIFGMVAIYLIFFAFRLIVEEISYRTNNEQTEKEPIKDLVSLDKQEDKAANDK